MPAVGERQRVVRHRRARIDRQRLFQAVGGARVLAPRERRASLADQRRHRPRLPRDGLREERLGILRPALIQAHVAKPHQRRPRRRAAARGRARTIGPRRPDRLSSCRRARDSRATALPTARAPARSGNTPRPRRCTRPRAAGSPPLPTRGPTRSMAAAGGCPRERAFSSRACASRICCCTDGSMRVRSGRTHGRVLAGGGGRNCRLVVRGSRAGGRSGSKTDCDHGPAESSEHPTVVQAQAAARQPKGCATCESGFSRTADVAHFPDPSVSVVYRSTGTLAHSSVAPPGQMTRTRGGFDD